MTLVALLAQKAGRPAWLRLIGLTLAGGLLTALVVSGVNAAMASNDAVATQRWAALFAIAIFGMYLTRRLAAGRFIGIFEDTAADLRQRFAAQVRAAPLRSIEALGSRLDHAIGDLAFLATTLESWVSGVSKLAFLLWTTLVVSLISSNVLVLWTVTLGLIGLRLWSRLRLVRGKLELLGNQSATLGEKVEQLLDGFVQAKLDRRLAASLATEIEVANRALYKQQNEVEDIKTRTFVGSFVIMFLLGSGTVAFAPAATDYVPPSDAYQMVIFFELAWVPLFGVLMAASEVARAEAAAEGVLQVLAELPAEPAVAASAATPAPFERLELHAVEVAYADSAAQRGFVIGPIDLSIRRGELVLLTGGNGSGKTTLLKTLLGLYPPDRGYLAVDGQVIGEAELFSWRSRFTAILSHQHLFDRLYGLSDRQPAQVASLLDRLGLRSVTDYRDQQFSNLALSTGQKMRLAMVVALLEARPICVFDEWTANQDPETTRWYYDSLLPELRAAGTTVIAVSHDRRYFNRADQLIVMAGGQIVRDSSSI